ncbi:hypothetical protein BDP27DRAFT_1236045 [Rhodocollybia butyracea]|uniref:Uncharacterized protein n=1 Tax=Rhodocollybia butyracea TaxID=206335 RepID=A0A9P5U002_9AGAR|nr:hypothetical protein BDP27DRAFT_1236045 [Rhodocollybia butyracea]
MHEWPSKSVPITDGARWLSAVMLYGPVDPAYLEAVRDMGGAILEAGKAQKWDKTEKDQKRAGSPAAARGISYGKGQPEPMRLCGKRQPMLEELMGRESFRRVAGFQRAALAAWFPANYEALQIQNNDLYSQLPALQPNFDNSVYSCMTVNFGPAMWSYIHTDSKNDPTIPCTVTAGGEYDHTKGGHIVLWDFNLVLEFPPGATIILPLALILQKGEKRVSVTQYTAGGIWHWLEYRGQTKDDFKHEDPAGFQHA